VVPGPKEQRPAVPARPLATRPLILVTLADPTGSADEAAAHRKNERFLEAVERAGGTPTPIDTRAAEGERRDSLAAMDGLLLTGGADLDPRLYGQAPSGARDPQADRDLLEQAAFRAATERGLPVLGICRGMQAINAFSGGTLVQHLDGHEGPAYLRGVPLQHPIEVLPGTRLGRLLGLDGAGSRSLLVNSYHHQGVAPDGVAPGLVASASAVHPDGVLVEGLEAADPGRFLIGIQCHPERTESTPPEFERLFAAFVAVAAARVR
jgi:putative glutamine amidotransferase